MAVMMETNMAIKLAINLAINLLAKMATKKLAAERTVFVSTETMAPINYG